MIVANDLHRWYGRNHAVRGVSLEVPPGQILGLLGPNGAGKSTTIRMLAGVLTPDRGSITIQGVDARRRPTLARTNIGYLPESAALYTEMSVLGMLRHHASLHGLSGDDRRKAVARAMERCRLPAERGRSRLGSLSKGYRQRAALAAAIVHDPPVLILDEPTNGLDPTQLREARSLIGELAQDRTVIVCSHVLSEIERICQRVVIIAGGRVLADDPLDSLRTPAGCIAEVLLDPEACRGLLEGAQAVFEPLEAGWTRLTLDHAPEADVPARHWLAHRLRGREIRELRDRRGGLEDHFVRVLDKLEADA
ncbi:MAG: ABC transporter ATP-binding protein [Planctomycetota bacterium]